jgi:hypothetical protein
MEKRLRGLTFKQPQRIADICAERFARLCPLA